jgi:hypothetical protein
VGEVSWNLLTFDTYKKRMVRFRGAGKTAMPLSLSLALYENERESAFLRVIDASAKIYAPLLLLVSSLITSSLYVIGIIPIM